MNNDYNNYNDSFANNSEVYNNFDYNSIDGLGESNYENEDIFAQNNSIDSSFNNVQENKALEEESSIFQTEFPFDEYGTQYENTTDLVDNSYDNVNNPLETSIETSIEDNNSTMGAYNGTLNSNQSLLNIDDYLNKMAASYNTKEESQSLQVEPLQTQEYLVPEEEQYQVEQDTVYDQPVEQFENNNTNEIEENDDQSIDKNQYVENYEAENTVIGANPVPSNYTVLNNLDSALDIETFDEKQSNDNVGNLDSENSTLVSENINIEDSNNNENTIEPLEEEKIEISDTPIEEINKLTEYSEENIESTNINAIFDKISINVKEASDIFRKNTEMKKKIDDRFDDLKKLQADVEIQKTKQIDEIDQYKDEVYQKLTEKKEEIEKRLNLLKEEQSNLEKEKLEFEQYKKSENENIEKIKREVQAAYDERREELNHVEDALRKQKDLLDEDRNQLSLDKIQYEADKNELANNLLKFNELVDSFTNGVKSVPKDN